MRYHVHIRAWRKGEFEARVEECKRATTGPLSSRSFDDLCALQDRSYLIEAESREEALAEGKERYVHDGLPPESEWGDLSLATATPVP